MSQVGEPIALMPTLIRWCEAMRASEVAKWQQKYRVDWDAAGELSRQSGKFCWRRRGSNTEQEKNTMRAETNSNEFGCFWNK